MTETPEFGHGTQFQRKADNPSGKQTYANILRKRSNTNIQRKLSKRNIAETNNNTAIAQKLQIWRQNKRDHNQPRSAASATSNADNVNTQNPRQNLEEEIPQHVIPIRRHILPAPPSKPSPQKLIQDSYNNQMESKNLQQANKENNKQTK